MLYLFKKMQFLHYIFPPYQPVNGLARYAESDVNMTDYNFNEPFNKDTFVDSDDMQIDKIYQSL